MKRNLKKINQSGTQRVMSNAVHHSSSEEFLIDSHGHQKVLLDFEEYRRLKQAANQALPTQKPKFDFHTLHGLALKAPLNPNPLFETEDDLWKGMP